MIRITIGFVQMRTHYVLLCKEPEAIHRIKNKMAGGVFFCFSPLTQT